MSNIEEIEKNDSNDDIEELGLDALNERIADLEDKLLRAAAELQNIQKRAEKEKLETTKYSLSEFAKDVLVIRDNLQLALNNCNENTEVIIEGVRLTMAELDKILERHGMKIINSIGERFDPNFHQAILEVEDKDKEPGTIVQVMQEGFIIYDRLLRPALVSVSKK
jgi:molecular chaperone GrpE